MGRGSSLFKHMLQVDFEEIRQKGTPAAKEVIKRVTEAGLEYFLGGPFILYREAVEEFFNTATLSSDKITATILSATKEPVKVSGKKATLRPEYIPLCDIFTKSVQARGGNYNSLTKAKIEMLVGLIEGGRKKKPAAKKPAPAKEKSESKDKEKIVFSDEEESASTSDRTESQKTGENPSDREGPNEEEHSGTSPDNTGVGASVENAEADADSSEEEEASPDNDQMKADIIACRILEDIELRVQAVGALYRECHEYRFDKVFKHMLPGLTDEQCFIRLKEIEETVMSLTNAETLHEALDRCTIVRPRARLQKLTVCIRKIKERYVEGTPEANLQVLVLEKLEIAKGEFAEEIDRLEAVVRQREKPHSPAPETDDGQNHEERVKTLIQEFADSTVHPLEEKIKKTVRLALRFVEKTRNDQVKAENRITAIEADYRDETVVRNNLLQQTKALEDKTSGIVDDLDRLERQTEQRLTEVTEDLVGSTLDRVSELEKKNASLEDRNNKLEADFKALTEQVNELINAKINADIAVEEANARAAKEVQDALDEEARIAKEPPRLTEKEIAERARNTAARYPGLAKSIAAQAAEDAKRLNTERERLEEFATAHKKKKAAPPSSVPAKRKRKTSKKAQVAGLLERITETVIENQPDLATHTEDEDEEQLERRSTRQRVSDTASQPQPAKRKRTKDMMDGFNFSDLE
ncbi:uncharacterized protein LOC124918175 [Impatiens glandulifera]|uniref:uncharacterized protein LOC124918175 n=1 Tax=Impatiens glandulifera TaxID=253017 RepID=UPI001FB08AAC|nr:uncharacterized protein LOC124918175 [Impatiens glandulifera]